MVWTWKRNDLSFPQRAGAGVQCLDVQNVGEHGAAERERAGTGSRGNIGTMCALSVCVSLPVSKWVKLTQTCTRDTNVWRYCSVCSSIDFLSPLSRCQGGGVAVTDNHPQPHLRTVSR